MDENTGQAAVGTEKRGKGISAWGLLSAGLFVVVVLTIGGFLGRWWWVLDVASSSRLQYLEIGALAALVYAVGRRRREFWVAMAVVLVNGGLMVPFYFGGGNGGVAGRGVRLMLSNVHSSNTEYGRLLELVRRERPDVIVLEEINREWVEAMGALRREYPYFIERPSQDNFGIGLYSRAPLKGLEAVQLGEIGVTSVLALLEVDGAAVHLLGMHPLPPGGAGYSRWRNDQLRETGRFVRGLGGNVVVLGDLNVTPWSGYFAELLEEGGLRDSRRGFGLQISWPAFCPLLGIPIDHCLVSRDVMVRDRRIGPSIGSDHYPVVVDIAVRSK